MYNCLIKKKVFFAVLISFFCIGNSAFCFDLADEISATFQKYFKWWYSESYLETPYASVYSKDPFKESFEDIENMSMQLKIAWAEYVENLLKEEGCSLSQKKIWSILYYYVPEFKTDLVRTMKVWLWDYNSRNYSFDENTVLKYCNEYFNCSKSKGMTISEIMENASDFRPVTPDTSPNVEQKCKEFFQENYSRGQDAQWKKQSLQVSHLWTDKYRNSTTDDSPYDIMTDIWNVWKLLYTDAERPITPVFYNLPMFSNSKDSLEDHKENGWSSYAKNGENDWKTWSNWNVWWSSVNPLPLPLPRWSEWPSMEWWYDSMADWLQSSRFKDSPSLWNACDENEWDSDDVEGEESDGSTPPAAVNLSDISVEEFEEVVDYMKWAVDKYTSLSEEKKAEIAAKAWDTSRFVWDVTPSQLDKTAEDIKNCWESCEWLRIDQKASCMIMCTCWEIESSIFDPDETPWLWPIFRIRFCAVPAVDTRFSIWWRKMYSIEEWVKEIYGVVDKLSREWRLWMWTQQYNFLDSSTKKMKVADTVAFTISIEFEDISDKFSKRSEQFKKMEIKRENENLQKGFDIYNNLENPVSKNRYRVIGKQWEETDDITTQWNPQWTKQSQSNLSVSSSSVVNSNSDSRASHEFSKSQLLDKWLDQQGNLWISIEGYIIALTEDTIGLDSKKDKR